MAEPNDPGGIRDRLQRAALDLFHEQGYDGTTAAGIAARVGVTERTFFRHFPDKRETLFGGEAVLRDALTAALADAPSALGPLDALFHAFRSVVPVLEANRPFAARRQGVISSTPALHERELAKLEVLADALIEPLRTRGVEARIAVLATRTGMAAFAQAATGWLDDPHPGLDRRLDDALGDIRRMISAG